MKIRLWRLGFLIVFASRAFADEPLYSVTLTGTNTFAIVSPDSGRAQLSFYALSEHMSRGLKKPNGRKIVGADYLGPIEIRTKDPKAAVQGVLGQISEQTGLTLGSIFNSRMNGASSATILQAFSDTAAVTLVLAPKQDDLYTLIGTYVIDERPEGSIDGTPAAIARMREFKRVMDGDSIAVALPGKIAATELRPEQYFRGAPALWISDSSGKGGANVLILMLKKDSEYSVAMYRDEAGMWTMIGEPIEFRGTRSPHLRMNTTNEARFSSLRVPSADGKSGVDLYLENGRIFKKEYAE